MERSLPQRKTEQVAGENVASRRLSASTIRSEKMKRPTTDIGDWILTFSDEEEISQNISDLKTRIEKIIAENRSGRVSVDEDMGKRSFLGRFLGLNPRVIQMHFAIEWCEDVASLIFFDDAGSEYRARNQNDQLRPNEEIRKQISHGEPTPCPIEECISVSRAKSAILEFLDSKTRPDWLSYHYVS